MGARERKLRRSGGKGRTVVVLGLRIAGSIGVVALALIAGYAVHNDSGHTAWEPLTSLVLFVPLTAIGSLCLVLRRQRDGAARAGAFATRVGLAGIALIVALDRTGRLVQYDRWIDRGLP